jgi:hypothetical protein
MHGTGRQKPHALTFHTPTRRRARTAPGPPPTPAPANRSSPAMPTYLSRRARDFSRSSRMRAVSFRRSTSCFAFSRTARRHSTHPAHMHVPRLRRWGRGPACGHVCMHALEARVRGGGGQRGPVCAPPVPLSVPPSWKEKSVRVRMRNRWSRVSSTMRSWPFFSRASSRDSPWGVKARQGGKRGGGGGRRESRRGGRAGEQRHGRLTLTSRTTHGRAHRCTHGCATHVTRHARAHTHPHTARTACPHNLHIRQPSMTDPGKPPQPPPPTLKISIQFLPSLFRLDHTSRMITGYSVLHSSARTGWGGGGVSWQPYLKRASKAEPGSQTNPAPPSPGHTSTQLVWFGARWVGSRRQCPRGGGGGGGAGEGKGGVRV